jgi:hypothetical protein
MTQHHKLVNKIKETNQRSHYIQIKIRRINQEVFFFEIELSENVVIRSINLDLIIP